MKDDFAPHFSRPEVEVRYKRDMFFRVAVDVGHKMNLAPWMVFTLQNVLPMVKLKAKTPQDREEELRTEAQEMVKYHLGKVGVVYSLPNN